MKIFNHFCIGLLLVVMLSACEKKIAEPTEAEIQATMQGEIEKLRENLLGTPFSELLGNEAFKIDNLQLKKLGCQNVQTGIFQCVVNTSFLAFLPFGLQKPFNQQISLKFFKTETGWAIIE